VTEGEVVKAGAPRSIHGNRIAAIAVRCFAGVPVSDTNPNAIGIASIDPSSWIFG
jgi:hypothetical protein